MKTCAHLIGLAGAAAAIALCVGPGQAAAGARPDAKVIEAIIRESIASYPGPCPCPYNSARNGSACGARSAYSRPGGYAPKCYARDVSKIDVETYRQTHAH